MTTRRFSFLPSALVASLALAGGCSLMGLDDIDLPQCQSDQDCTRALNGPAGLYEGCHAFACVPDGDRRTCQRISGEICDGFDNDCDYIVDENNGVNQVFAPQVRTVHTTTPITTNIDVSTSADRQALASWALEGGGAQVASLPPDADGTASSVGYKTNATINMSLKTLSDGCGHRAGESGNCDIADIVRAGDAVGTVAATVNTAGCAGGLLRIAASRDETPELLVDRGPGRRSSVYRGVSRVEYIRPCGRVSAPCTENTTPECEQAIEAARLDITTLPDGGTPPAIATSCGAGHPAIAAQPGPQSQALVAFLSAPASYEGGAEVDVEVAGVYRRLGGGGGDFEWMDGANEGAPLAVGRTTVAVTPSVVALPGRGYLVAHADPAGSLAIHFVPTLSEPPENNGLRAFVPPDAGMDAGVDSGMDAGADSGMDSGMGCPALDGAVADTALPPYENRTGVETPMFGEVVDLPPITVADGSAETARLALGRLQGDLYEVGIAFRDSSDPSAAKVRFERISLDFSTGTPVFGELGASFVVSTGDNERVVGTPSILHVDRGFAVEGFSRRDRTVDADSLGGFVVAWPAQRGEIHARRISDLDGLPLIANSDFQPIVLSVAPEREGAVPPNARSVALYATGTGPHFAYYDRDNNDLAYGLLACGSPAAASTP